MTSVDDLNKLLADAKAKRKLHHQLLDNGQPESVRKQAWLDSADAFMGLYRSLQEYVCNQRVIAQVGSQLITIGAVGYITGDWMMGYSFDREPSRYDEGQTLYSIGQFRPASKMFTEG